MPTGLGVARGNRCSSDMPGTAAVHPLNQGVGPNTIHAAARRKIAVVQRMIRGLRFS